MATGYKGLCCCRRITRRESAIRWSCGFMGETGFLIISTILVLLTRVHSTCSCSLAAAMLFFYRMPHRISARQCWIWQSRSLPGVNKAIELGIADPDHLGIMGHSNGGYSTVALIVQTKRFAAAMEVAGMADLVGLYGEMDKDGTAFGIPIIERGQDALGGTPWEFREKICGEFSSLLPRPGGNSAAGCSGIRGHRRCVISWRSDLHGTA